MGCIDRAGEGRGYVGIVNDQRGIGRVQDHAGTLRRVVRVNRHKRCSRPQCRKQGHRDTDAARQPQRHHIAGACPVCGDVFGKGGRRRVELGVREGGGPILHGHGVGSGCRMRCHGTHHILRSGGYLRQVWYFRALIWVDSRIPPFLKHTLCCCRAQGRMPEFQR